MSNLRSSNTRFKIGVVMVIVSLPILTICISYLSKSKLEDQVSLTVPAALSGYKLNATSEEARSVLKKLTNKAPDLSQAHIFKSGIMNLYTVVNDGKIAYTDSQANFLISGPILDLNSKIDLTRVQKNAVLAFAQLEEISAMKPVVDVMAKATPASTKSSTPVVESPLSVSQKDDNTINLPAHDAWKSGFYIPDNYLGANPVVSEETKAGLEKMVKRYPSLITSGRISAEGMIRSQIANSMPDDHYAAVYKPVGEVMDRITVFADPKCPKCQELHSELGILLENGIEVRYILFPRDFEDQEMRVNLANLYCLGSSNRVAATDALFRGEGVPQQGGCDVNVVDNVIGSLEFYDVKGTPTIFHGNSGYVVPGRIDAEFLVQLSKNGKSIEVGNFAVN